MVLSLKDICSSFIVYNNVDFGGRVPKECLDSIAFFEKYRGKENKGLENAVSKNLDLVKFFVRNGATNYNTALLKAVELNKKKIVLWLINKGANNFDTALPKSAQYGHAELMEILINFGANTFKKACQMAAQNGYIDIVKFLISKGADNYNEIMVFAGYGGYKKIVQMMLDKGVTNFSETLHHATRGAKVEIVHLMASKGGRPINRTFEEAIKVGNIEILKMFIEMRATDTGPTWFYKNDNEIVQIAAKNGQIGIIEYILSKRVRIDFNTAFENAIIGGHKKIMMMMINHGATKLNFGLNKAVRAGHLELTKILLNLGAPIQMQALERALMSEKKEIIDLIFTTENISKITLKQVNKCLCIAASKGNLPIIKMIIQNGADNYPKAITEAANKNHKEIVRYLVDKWCEVE